MSAMPGSDLRDDVYYPESDGKPMAETPLHRDEMSALIWIATPALPTLISQPSARIPGPR